MIANERFVDLAFLYIRKDHAYDHDGPKKCADDVENVDDPSLLEGLGFHRDHEPNEFEKI